jgi:Domain of unknown function (DUF3471)
VLRRLLIATLLMPPASIAAQATVHPQPPTAAMMEFEKFADIYGSRLVAAFDSIPAARYDYRPMPVQQSVGYIAQHLEHANYALCGSFGRLKHPRSAKDALPDTLKARWPKDTLVARLRASFEFCDAALDRVPAVNTADVVGAMLGFETDLAEHYSQIAVYMRLLGLVPPSALPPRRPPVIALPAGTLSRYVGVYRLTEGLDLDVTVRDGALWIRSDPGGSTVRLWPESATKFFIREVDADVTFTDDAKSDATGLVWSQYGRDRSAARVR